MTAPVIVTAPSSVKWEVFPIRRNQLFIRLENIGDRFDTDRWNLKPADTTVQFPLDQVARDLFAKANWNNARNISSIVYSELSLTGNQLYSDVVAGKT